MIGDQIVLNWGNDLGYLAQDCKIDSYGLIF